MWNVFVGAESLWAVGQWINSLFSGPTPVLGSVELHPPFFSLLATLGVASLVALNYEWIAPRLRTQRSKFGDVNPEIKECLEHITIRIDKIPPSTVSKLTRLDTTLKPFSLTTEVDPEIGTAC